jgi:hypothetical protein
MMMKPRRWSAEGVGPSETASSRERAARTSSCAIGDGARVPQGLSDAIRAALNALVAQPVNAMPAWSDVRRRAVPWSTAYEHAAGWGTRSL